MITFVDQEKKLDGPSKLTTLKIDRNLRYK